MKFKKILFGLIMSFMMMTPFVLADIKGAPSHALSIGILVVALAIVGGFIVGSVFLIKFIIRKIRNS